MNNNTVRLYAYDCRESKTWLFAALFIAGNILLPQLCHFIPQGGPRLLPIYFFTLVGAYKYGWRVGLLTAVASPLINSACFGMPAQAMLPVILLKSVILALAAGFVAQRFRRVTLPLLAAVVAAYQLLGGLGEWAILGSFAAALQDWTVGLGGMLLQVAGGYLLINYLLRK